MLYASNLERLYNMAPSYITNLILLISIQAVLCLQISTLLIIPRTKSSLGDRVFSVVAPKLWNFLPTDPRQSTAFDHFKSGLKTFLFNTAYVN